METATSNEDMEQLKHNLAACLAASEGDHDTLRMLVLSGVPVNMMDQSSGSYPIHHACWGGSVKCLEILLRQPGIDVNRKVDDEFGTALHAALRHKSGSDNRMSAEEARFLSATWYGFLANRTDEFCELLLSAGADINAVDKYGEFPFLQAISVHPPCSRNILRRLLNGNIFLSRTNGTERKSGDIGEGPDDTDEDSSPVSRKEPLPWWIDLRQIRPFKPPPFLAGSLPQSIFEAAPSVLDWESELAFDLDVKWVLGAFAFGSQSTTPSLGGRWPYSFGIPKKRGTRGDNLYHHEAVYHKNTDALAVLLEFEEKHDNLRLSPEDRYDVVDYAASFRNIGSSGLFGGGAFGAFGGSFGAGAHTSKSMAIMTSLFSKYGDDVKKQDMGDHLLATCVKWQNIEYFNHLLQHGCRACSVDSSTGKVFTRCLAEICQSGSGESVIHYFNAISPHLDSAVVERINQEFAGTDEHQATLCVAYRNHRVLLRLLEIGFDVLAAPVAKIDWKDGGVEKRESTEFTLPFVRMQENFCQPDSAPVYNIFSLAIMNFISGGFSENVLENVLKTLIASGASVSAELDNEMSPLATLICLNGKLLSEPRRMKVLCALIEAGADLNHKSKQSPFICSDVAIAAACNENALVLTYLLINTGLKPSDLLMDMKQIISRCQSHDGDITAGQKCSSWRTSAAIIIQVLLRYASKSGDLLKIVKDLDACTACESGADEEPEWNSFYSEFENVDTLQHLSRLAIVNQLKMNHTTKFSLETLIEELQLESPLTEHLLFKREIKNVWMEHGDLSYEGFGSADLMNSLEPSNLASMEEEDSISEDFDDY